MSAILDPETVPTPRTPQERVELAGSLYRQFRGRCFWSSPDDLEINESRIPFVIKGLRGNGGHLGFKLAGKLRANACERGNDLVRLDWVADSA